MRKLGLNRRRQRRRTRTTIAGKGPASPNLLKDLRAERPRQVLVTDITYVALPKGFAYVAVILDLFSRRALGWACSLSLDSEIVVQALAHAVKAHELPEGWIHHSDRGCHYTSHEYKALVQAHRGLLSNSGKGNPYDNATMESFFKTYKYEEANLAQYDSLEELAESLDDFLNDYNLQRLHSSLGDCSPVEFEQLHAEAHRQVCVR
jgi:putative transposase